jgi:hypothetical protein
LNDPWGRSGAVLTPGGGGRSATVLIFSEI